MPSKKGRIYHPEVYHGQGKKSQYFEGWYFKFIDKSQKRSLAIIPGIIFGQKNFAFIQILNGKNGETFFIKYPLSLFEASSKTFTVTIGRNHFSLNSITLDIDEPDIKIKGEVRFAGIHGWPQTPGMPGAMGWFARIPFMQCYHGVLGFDHELTGNFTFNGEKYNFNQGRGYIEKDWGSAFPESYIWMQSNHFERLGVSFMASIATIPWLGSTFGGFIIGLSIEGKLYPFATYNLAKITKLIRKNDLIEFKVKRRKYTLNVSAKHEQTGEIKGPTSAGMDMRVMESLTSVIELELSKDGEIIFSGIGKNAGMEVQGNFNTLKKYLGLAD